MITKELGQTGVYIPEVGIGTWNYHAGPWPLRSGLEAGALFIDTAESYGREDMVREAVDGRRDRVFIATKVSPQNFRSQDLRKSVDASLLRLGIDAIDLLQLHAPNSSSIPIEETMGAMKRTLGTLIDRVRKKEQGMLFKSLWELSFDFEGFSEGMLNLLQQFGG